tara:strand:+ start:233 stop:634 length:402 start_codon:yes stop_codon:yes gene_type:complete
MKVLIIHGPNMNLIGLKKIEPHGTLTLDKINSMIRLTIKNKKKSVKIIQTNSEAKIVSYIQKQRNKIDHIIISPEAWNDNGYVLRDTLKIIKKPISFIISNKNKSIFESMMNGSNMFFDPNYLDGYIQSIKSL